MTPTHHEPEPGQDDPFIGEPPAGDANPGDYRSQDQQGGVSEETGTTYSTTGEAEVTPHDEELLAEEDDDANAIGGATS
jgi:hypothetical protein